MNISTSECSSGCESGWTTYLDQFSDEGKGTNVNEDQEDEELSMVSDATSGPPHLHENCVVDPQYRGYAYSSQEDTKKSKQKSKQKETKVKKQHNLCLEDTASSSMFHFSQCNALPPENHNSVEQFSQVFSGAYFEGKSMPKKHLGFFKSSIKGKSVCWEERGSKKRQQGFLFCLFCCSFLREGILEAKESSC